MNDDNNGHERSYAGSNQSKPPETIGTFPFHSVKQQGAGSLQSVSTTLNYEVGVQLEGLKFRTISNEFSKLQPKKFQDFTQNQSDRNQEGRQIAKNDCRVYQRSFARPARRDVHRYILRDQYLPRCVEYAVKTCTFGCDDTCTAKNG